MVLAFGILFGIMVGVLIGAAVGGFGGPKYRVHRDDPYYSSRYLNNPVVRELDEQEKTRDVR